MFGLVSIYVCGTKTFFESYFSDRLTFSNIRSRTSHRIYKPSVPLRAPETFSSLSTSRISIFNAHVTLFVGSMIQLRSHNSFGHSSFSKLTLELALEVRALLLPLADLTTSRIIAEGEEVNVRSKEVHH